MFHASAGGISASQGKTYYKQEYSCGDYYTRDGTDNKGVWSGRLADELGLKGEIGAEDFAAVLEGRTGAGLEQVIPDPPRGEHRAAWDFVCSPDKSVSVMALVGGDAGIIDDVSAANAEAMRELEAFAMAKGADQKYRESGNIIVASFLHDTSRKLDPQLHWHNLVMNMTRRVDGKLVALEPREMYRAQRYATAVFRAALAKRLLARGYRLEFERDGNFRIVGVGKDLCGDFSKRRKDILARMDQLGVSGPEAAQNAALHTRDAKNRDVDKAGLHTTWKAIASDRGADLDALRRDAARRAGVALRPAEKAEQARASIRYAMEHLSERKATFAARELYAEALRHGVGKITIEDLHAAVKLETDLICVERDNVPGGVMTTRAAVEIERRNLAIMEEGRGSGQAILEGTTFALSKELADGQRKVADFVLTTTDRVVSVEGKPGAGKTFTLAEIIKAAKAAGWECHGFAPSSSAAKELGKANLKSSTIAALEHAQEISSHPHQLWIVDEAGQAGNHEMSVVLEKAREVGAKVVLVGDRMQHHAVGAGRAFAQLIDAGMAVVRLDEIQRQARPAIAIHAAAAAAREGRWELAAQALAEREGAPLPELQQAAAAIRDGRYQVALEVLEARSAQAHALIDAVKAAANGNCAEAVALLDGAGQVEEIADRGARHRAIAAEFMRTPEGQSCLVIAPSHAERGDLNRRIRKELIRAGRVEEASIAAQIRVDKRLTKAESRDARNYEAGDHVHFARASKKYGIAKGAEGRVLDIDQKRNLVRVELTSGQIAEFDPNARNAKFDPRHATPKVSVIENRELAVGDRIQYREATKKEGASLKSADGFRIANGDIGTVQKINHESGRAVILLDGDKPRSIELDLKRAQPIDHAYCVTSHASQSQTVDRVLACVDTSHSAELVNAKQFLVSTSRAAYETKVFTDNRAELARAVSRDPEKSSALDLDFIQQQKTQEIRTHGPRLESRREPTRTEATQQQAAGERHDRHYERNDHGRGPAAATAAGRPTVSLDVLPGAKLRTRGDLAGRPTVARGDGAANLAAPQHDARAEALRTIGPATGRAADRGRETDNRFDRSQEAARRLSPKIDYGDALREGRGRETSRLRDPASRTSTSHAQGSSRDGDRNRAGIQYADHGIDASRGNQVSRDRTEPAQYAGTHHGPGEMGTPDSRPPATARRDAPAQVASAQVSAWDRLSEQAQALKNNIQDRTTTPATEATVSTNATRQTPESRLAYARAHALEQQLATTEKQFETAQGWQQREQLGKQVEGLREQHYEATQDARMDIDQRRIQELKTEHQALEHLKTTEATSYQQRAPLEQRQEAIKNEIYTLRHGERSELGNLSRQLGREEHHLHAAHRTLNSAAKRHPEALGRMKSPATRDAVNNMSNPELQAFARNMHDAARHAQSASRLLDKPPQEQAALKHHLDQAKVSHEAAQRAVDRDRGYSLSH